MGRKQRRDNVRNGGVAKTVAIGERISVSEVVQDTKASSTKISYSRYVTGNRGWVEWTAAQGVASSGLGENAAVRVCEYYYFRTNCFALGLSVGNQIVAALEGHYEATTRCGGGAWNVISSEGGAMSTSGNPARSTNVHDIKAAHKKARARAGNTEVDSVDVLEPVHIRTFHALYFAGRELAACDPTAVMLHSAVTFGMSCMLRFSELSSLTTQHLGRSEMWPKFSLDEATKNSFKKQVYELAPWPTSVGLDPRYVSIFPCSSHSSLCALCVGSVHSLQQADDTFFRDRCSGILFPLACMSWLKIGPCAGVCHVDAHARRSAGVCFLPHEDGRRHGADVPQGADGRTLDGVVDAPFVRTVRCTGCQPVGHSHGEAVGRPAVRGPASDTNVDNGEGRLDRPRLFHPVPGSVQPP